MQCPYSQHENRAPAAGNLDLTNIPSHVCSAGIFTATGLLLTPLHSFSILAAIEPPDNDIENPSKGKADAATSVWCFP